MANAMKEASTGSGSKRAAYFDEYDLFVYDKAIGNHPYVDGCNSLMVDHLRDLVQEGQRQAVVDLGTGTGRVIKMLRWLPGVDACGIDVDARCKDYFEGDPELKNVQLHCLDLISDDLPDRWDVGVLRGVFHHIPLEHRDGVARKVLASCSRILIADEALAEYETKSQRQDACRLWYGHIVSEAKRRGLNDLAILEKDFLRHEISGSEKGDVFDHKESVARSVDYFLRAGARLIRKDTIGDFKQLGGGFYVVTVGL